MTTFDEDAKLHNSLNNFVYDIIYNHYTQKLWDAVFLNAMDRGDLSEQFISRLLKEYGKEYKFENEVDSMKLTIYVAKEIDKLIPKIYFMELNEDLSQKYTPILVKRMYDVKGKDGFEATKKIKYHFTHDFTEIHEMIKDSMATDKQLDFLKSLGKKHGYLLWNEEYLAKVYATQMIDYLSEKIYEQPVIFSFFFVSK